MPWYLYLAFKQLFPSGRRLSFFSLVSILGVMLGVWVLVVVQSVMNGFGAEISDKLIQTYGDVRVESGRINYQPDELIERLQAMPEVAIANPYAEGMVMIQHRDRPAFPIIRGIDVDSEEMVMPVDKFLIQGKVDDLDDNTIFLSSQLAVSLGASKGSTVEVYSPLILDRVKKDEMLLPRELEVAGIFETGYGQIDNNTVVVTLRLMQELYGLDQGIHGVMLKLQDGVDEEVFAYELNGQFDSELYASTWLDANADLLFVLRLEKSVMFFIIIFIILVASFSIASTLLTSVVRKTREIGLLGAMGGRPRQIAWIFALQGFIIGVSGTAIGLLAAFVSLHFRNDIVHFLAHLTETQSVLSRFYQFINLPAQYSTSDLITITLSAIIVSTLAGLVPAIRAGRLRPATALRNE